MASRSRLAEYERLNGKYLRDAEVLLRKKDLPQASEKLWGAAAEIIKAVAAKRGIRLGTHRSLGEFVERLDLEHPELDLLTDFHVANSLHVNFYEDYYPERTVLKGAETVRNFVEKLRRLS